MVTVSFGQFSLEYKRDWAQLLGHVHSGSVPYRKMVPRVIDYLEIALAQTPSPIFYVYWVTEAYKKRRQLLFSGVPAD